MSTDRRATDRPTAERRSPEREAITEFVGYFDELGGRAAIELVHKHLYTKLFAHPWLGKFFEGKDRAFLESQQTEFMMGVLGGGKIYGGRGPLQAHKHQFITEEIFQIRHEMLKDAMKMARIPEHVQARWLNVDLGMRRSIVKERTDQCVGRYANEDIVVFPDPDGGPNQPQYQYEPRIKTPA